MRSQSEGRVAAREFGVCRSLRLCAKRHDPKLREELRRITREYGKLKERWYLGGGKEPPNEKSPGLSSVVRLEKRESRDT